MVPLLGTLVRPGRIAQATRRARALALMIPLGVALAPARHDAAAQEVRLEPASRRYWVASAVLIATAIALDQPARDAAARNRSHALDQLARNVDPLGRARYLVPALVGGYLVPRLAGAHRLADAALRVGLGYAVADGIESVLKPAIGRHRPDDERGTLRFRPFSNDDAWHSLPSAHTVHAFAIAAGIADEAHRPWVTVVAFGTASIVGLQRVYTRAHWASDVAASSVLAVAASGTTRSWLRRRGDGTAPAASHDAARPAWSVRIASGRVLVSGVF